MRIEPYLFFHGRSEEAAAFYARALNAELHFAMRFSEAPEAPPPGTVPPGHEDRIMHAELRIGQTTVMISDGGCRDTASFDGFALAISFPDTAEAARRFEALADGGEITMAFGPSFFSPGFGMLRDRFGVNWTVVTDMPVD